MLVNEKIAALRKVMADKKINAYYIPTDDFHHSEYVGDYFKARAYMTNFYGSAGYVVVTQKEACLWTDARYFQIAERAIAGSVIKLMKMGEENVPTLLEYLKANLTKDDVLGFDGRVVSATLYQQFKDELEVSFHTNEDLVDMIWEERPPLSKEKAYFLDLKYVGKSTQDKLNDIREVMKQHHASLHVVSTLDDIAWIFNMRGNDVHSSPVVLSYAVIGLEDVHLFMDESKCDDALRQNFEENHVTLHPYNDVYDYLKQVKNETVMIDDQVANAYLLECISCDKVICPNPSTMMKAIKNEVEVENSRYAHLIDGVAVTKFMIWLKDEIQKREISELEVAEVLEKLRSQNDGFIELSFDTIAGYNANGASMHYTASQDNYVMCKNQGFLLVDSGATYKTGTTDITRTFMLGEAPQEWKEHYTMVLRSHLALSNAKFLYGCKGWNLDTYARAPLWEKGLDFKHGTGHGVGHVLLVHEGPNNIHWGSARKQVVFEEGMITSNEPGYYEDGSHGVRIENLIVCHKTFKNEYGQFMEFEDLTLCPYDLDPVIKEELTQYEIQQLNAYHKKVYEKLAPYMNEYELEKLKYYTREI